MSADHYHPVSCDSCEINNFNEVRYKCLICKDYDLCGECYEDGKVSMNHTVDHPIQAVITNVDKEEYFFGEKFQNSMFSYTCPCCGDVGLNINSIENHLTTLCKKLYSVVVCPVCLMESRKSNEVVSDFLAHVRRKHTKSRTDAVRSVSIVDDPTEMITSDRVRLRRSNAMRSRWNEISSLIEDEDFVQDASISDDITRSFMATLVASMRNDFLSGSDVSPPQLLSELRSLMESEEITLNFPERRPFVRSSQSTRVGSPLPHDIHRRNINEAENSSVTTESSLATRSQTSSGHTTQKSIKPSEFRIYEIINKFMQEESSEIDQQELQNVIYNLFSQWLNEDISNMTQEPSEEKPSNVNNSISPNNSVSLLEKETWNMAASVDPETQSTTIEASPMENTMSESSIQIMLQENNLMESNAEDLDSEASQGEFII